MDLELNFQGKLAIQQRVLPSYRTAFFDLLSQSCSEGLSVFSGQPLPREQINTSGKLNNAALYPARNINIFHTESPLYRCWQIGIIDWLEKWNPDVLIVEANPRYLSTPGAVRWMHARQRPVLGWGLGAPAIRGYLAFLRMYSRRRFLHSLDGVISYSQRGRQEYRSIGMPEDRVFVATNVVVPSPSHPIPQRPLQFDGRPKVLFVGRLQARKRLDLLLKACARLPTEIQPRIWIVGEGPVRDEIQSLAKRIYPKAEFTGALYGIELERFFLEADLFVLPGTGGLAIQQAMSYGLPIIAAQGDGTQDDLVRPENGWTIPSTDLTSLANALREALENPSRLRRMGAESYRIVAEQANLDRMKISFISALNSLHHS